MWQRRRRFPESPKHPIDCSTSLAEPSWYTGHLPCTSCSSRYSSLLLSSSVRLSLYPSLFLRSSIPHSHPSLAISLSLSLSFLHLPSRAALGMANTPPCRGYVSRMRPPPPPTTTHPSLVYVMLGASQYGRQLIQPSPLFLP